MIEPQDGDHFGHHLGVVEPVSMPDAVLVRRGREAAFEARDAASRQVELGIDRMDRGRADDACKHIPVEMAQIRFHSQCFPRLRLGVKRPGNTLRGQR